MNDYFNAFIMILVIAIVTNVGWIINYDDLKTLHEKALSIHKIEVMQHRQAICRSATAEHATNTATLFEAINKLNSAAKAAE